MYLRYIIFLSILLFVVADAKWNVSAKFSDYRTGDRSTLNFNQDNNVDNVLAQKILLLDQRIMLNPANARLYAERSVIYLMIGKLDKSLRDMNVAVELDNDNPDYLTARSKIHHELNHVDKAFIDIARAIDLRPEMYVAHLNRGILNFSIENYHAAVRDFGTCIELSPMESRPYFNRAFAYLALNALQQANTDFKVFLLLSDDPRLKYIVESELLKLGKTL